MRTIHWNGENWYERDWSIAHRIRHWVIWIGGWEKANGEGWHILRKNPHPLLYPGWRGHIQSPTPWSLFGHRFTHYGWGWNLRIGRDYLTYVKRQRYCDGRTLTTHRLYLSPDGTPGQAHVWLLGWPHEVEVAARQRSTVRNVG